MKYITPLLLLVSYGYCEVKFSERAQNFSLELLHFSQLDTDDGHVLISPFGIWTLLTGVASGTSGESFDQLKSSLRLPNDPTDVINGYTSLTNSMIDPGITGKLTLTNKNFVFLDDSITTFWDNLKKIETDFKLLVKVIDFENSDEAARIANDYIRNSVGDPESDVLKPSLISNSMLLTNVVSFNAIWSSPFQVSDTRRKQFFDENGEVIGAVNMMIQKGYFTLSAIPELQNTNVLDLPLNTGKYSMLIFLPPGNVKLQEMYTKFTQVTLGAILKELENDDARNGQVETYVSIPRFKINTNMVMNKALNSMGVHDIFNTDVANFDKVSNDKISVSAIVHKTDLEVTEIGTVLGSTAITAPFDPVNVCDTCFNAHRPFMYLVIEKSTSTVIFGGFYTKPTLY